MEHFPLMVAGAKPSGTPQQVVGAFDRQPIATVDAGGEAVVDMALATAYALFRNRDAWLAPAIASRRIQVAHAQRTQSNAGLRKFTTWREDSCI